MTKIFPSYFIHLNINRINQTKTIDQLSIFHQADDRILIKPSFTTFSSDYGQTVI